METTTARRPKRTREEYLEDLKKQRLERAEKFRQELEERKRKAQEEKNVEPEPEPQAEPEPEAEQEEETIEEETPPPITPLFRPQREINIQDILAKYSKPKVIKEKNEEDEEQPEPPQKKQKTTDTKTIHSELFNTVSVYGVQILGALALFFISCATKSYNPRARPPIQTREAETTTLPPPSYAMPTASSPCFPSGTF